MSIAWTGRRLSGILMRPLGAVWLGGLLAQALAAQPLPLPPPATGGFFIRFDVDGRHVEKSLYSVGGAYDFIVIAPGEQPGRHGLQLVSNALKLSPPAEGLQISVVDQLRLDDRAPLQTFPLTGVGMCNDPDNPDRPIVGEALYARAHAGTRRVYNTTNFWPGAPLTSGNLDQERANTESIGFRTAEPTTLGSYNGVLEVTRVDTAQQVLEGRFRFTAFRDIVIRKTRDGSFEGRCDHPEDFQVGTVQVTRGEFRMRYCHDPVQPGNSRYCPGSLSPEVPR